MTLTSSHSSSLLSGGACAAALLFATVPSLAAAPCAADDGCFWKGSVRDLDVQRTPDGQASGDCIWKGPPHHLAGQANPSSDRPDCIWKGPPGHLTPLGAPSGSPDGECHWKGTGHGLDVERGPCWVNDYAKNPHPLGAIDALVPADGDPTIADHPCPRTDVNGDRRVDEQDLIMVLESWGAHHGAADCNADGCVDALDLVAVLATWGVCG